MTTDILDLPGWTLIARHRDGHGTTVDLSLASACSCSGVIRPGLAQPDRAIIIIIRHRLMSLPSRFGLGHPLNLAYVRAKRVLHEGNTL